MSETRRYNLTLIKVDRSARDRFRALSYPESFFEIRPNRGVGERTAYSILLTQSEYEAALEDAQDPNSNLIAVEPDYEGGESSVVPGATVDSYHAMQDADSLGLTGKGVDVGIIERGFGAVLDAIYAGRIKAVKGWDGIDPRDAGTGHGSRMLGLAVPPGSRAVGAAQNGTAGWAAALYWMVDEIGVHVVGNAQFYPESTVIADAIKNAVSKGILIFSSAGNGTNNDGVGVGVIDFPARLPGVMPISNYAPSSDAKDSSSNWGSGIWAAGAGSSLSVYDPDANVVSMENGGTSAAAMMVAGIAARYMTGGRSPGNVKSYLASTARPTGVSPLYEGNGVLQLAAAEKELQEDKPQKTDLVGAPMTGTDGEPLAGAAAQDGVGNPEPGACG